MVTSILKKMGIEYHYETNHQILIPFLQPIHKNNVYLKMYLNTKALEEKIQSSSGHLLLNDYLFFSKSFTNFQ